MDRVYQVLSKTINIKPEREAVTKIYNKVVKTIEDGLKEDELFKVLYWCKVLSGSYADKLKISKANEFDVVMRFHFPEKDLIKIIYDKENKGNVFIDLTDALTRLSDNAEKANIHRFLSGLVKDGLLVENKFQSWFQGCMAKVLNKIKKLITCDDIEYKLKYQRSGPAHTIYVNNLVHGEFLFSVDLVPGFVFEADKSVSVRPLTRKYWEAIPRPMKSDIQCVNCSFRTSYADSERYMILGKCQLKNALRLMKKYRDLEPKLQLLKSYYLKTIFLWINEEKDEQYWEKPIFQIMPDVFKKLEDALFAGKIEFFWDRELNMLAHIRPTQLKEMYNTVSRSRKIFDNRLSQKVILDLFLSSKEQERLTADDQRLVTDSLEDTNNFLMLEARETDEDDET